MNKIEQIYQDLRKINNDSCDGQEESDNVLKALALEEKNAIISMMHDEAKQEDAHRKEKKEIIKNITILENECEGASNGGEERLRFCVDKKLHIANNRGWYDNGEEDSCNSDWSFTECDCGKDQLPTSVTEQVEKAIISFFKTNTLPPGFSE